jgi:potassium-dependent mechanosensitive channel
MYIAEQCGQSFAHTQIPYAAPYSWRKHRRKIDGCAAASAGNLRSNRLRPYAPSNPNRFIHHILLGFKRKHCSSVDPQRVVELLKSVAANQPSVAKEPAPQAYVVNFASGAVNFHLRVWTERYEDWVQVRSDLSVAVDDELTRENIAIA